MCPPGPCAFALLFRAMPQGGPAWGCERNDTEMCCQGCTSRYKRVAAGAAYHTIFFTFAHAFPILYMTPSRNLCCALLLPALTLLGCARLVKDCDPDRAAADSLRIVAVHPTLVQMIYALGAEDKLVGRDQSSTWPEAARRIPSVKYMRALSDEGILSLNPTLLLLTPENGPAPVINKLQHACLKVEVLDNKMDRKALLAKMRTLGGLIGKPTEADSLIRSLQAEYAELDSLKGACTQIPQVLSFHSRARGGSLFINGTGTAVQFLLDETQARPALVVEGVKEIGKESLLAASPDYLLIDRETEQYLGGIAGIRAHPLLKNSPAAQKGQVVVIERVHLFGPNAETGRFLKQLIHQLHPELQAGARP